MKTPSLRTPGPHLLSAAPTLRSPQFLNLTPAHRVHQMCLRSQTEFRLKLNLRPKPNLQAGMLSLYLVALENLSCMPDHALVMEGF